MTFRFIAFLAFGTSVALASPQQGARTSSVFNFDADFGLSNEETTTPIPILRYLDTQNPDGSYTYGYESGDGTYKIETRYPSGEVKGKYGYYDPTGQLREIEYGATPKEGFKPTGEGLLLPEASIQPAQQSATEAPRPRPSGRRTGVIRRRRPRPRSPHSGADVRTVHPSQRRRVPEQRPILNPRPLIPTTPAPTIPEQPRFVAPPQPAAHPRFLAPQQPVFDANAFAGHPAQGIDLKTGSYSVFYSG